jgi:hypothetical protein
MKKTLTAIVAAAMTLVMSITAFADLEVPTILPEEPNDFLDGLLNFFDMILGWIGEIASLFFK